MDEEVLTGGVSNAGSVVRAGPHVLRPSNPHSETVHAFLRRVRAKGFAGVPAPVGIEADGRERLEFVDGEVPLPPYPDWARTDAALGSLGVLLARYHWAAALDTTSAVWTGWNREIADPAGGRVVCHNDICLENVVFRDGTAVAFLDFDYCSPGRPTYDLAQLARMCVPIDDDESAAQLGWEPADRPARLRLVCDHYGLDGRGRAEVLEVLDDAMARGGEFVKRHAEAGEPAFVLMWEWMGGQERWDRRRRWWATGRDDFADAVA